MKLLALDTSSDACSVAVAVGEDVLEYHVTEPREHTRILVPTIRRLLAEADTALAALDAIVLGNGPGSFIGVRIGASVAQGLGFGAGLKIVPVSSLAAVAAEVLAEDAAGRVVVAQDARMNQVYAGSYGRGPRGIPVADGDERIVAADAVFREPEAFVAAGRGWSRYPALVDANRDRLERRSGVEVPRARHLLSLGRAAFREGCALDPADVAPAYLRGKVARAPEPA